MEFDIYESVIKRAAESFIECVSETTMYSVVVSVIKNMPEASLQFAHDRPHSVTDGVSQQVIFDLHQVIV